MLGDDRTLTPRLILDTFCDYYQRVQGREPAVRYMGNHWYSINGETVHRAMLLEEIERLHALSKSITRELPVAPPPLAAPPALTPVSIPSPISLPPTMSPVPALPDPVMAAATIPPAPIERSLITRLINRLRRL